MKKLRILLLLAISSSVILFGCGKKEETATQEAAQEEVSAEDIGLGTETEDAPVVEEEETKDGMVRSKLTNEWIDEALADERPIAVMYPVNKVALPQYGLDQIDVFYEILEEGKMSRQLAIMKDWKDLEQIGNIRSIRDYFVYCALEWDPIIVHFGGPALYVSDILLRADVENINGTGTADMGSDYGAYYRVKRSGVASEHTAYTNGEKLLAAIDKAGFSLTHRDEYYVADHFQFASESSPNTLEDAKGAKDATFIDLSNCYPVTKSTYTYNKDDGLYYKTIYGDPQCDAESGNQLAFANVITQNTYYEVRDPKDYLYFQIHDTTRDGYFFTQGKAIHITWEKPDNLGINSNYTPTRYFDDDGNEIVINTGKTAICIVEDGDEVIFE